MESTPEELIKFGEQSVSTKEDCERQEEFEGESEVKVKKGKPFQKISFNVHFGNHGQKMLREMIEDQSCT